jgi:hypothetical protein
MGVKIAIILSAIVLFACGAFAKEPLDMVITLERTMCFGTCPVYKLTIYGNGEIVYEGKKHVKEQGNRTARISEDKVRGLISEFERLGYFELKDSYIARGITDMPSAITSITIGSRTKAVRHYYGDKSAPRDLMELEKRIDTISGSSQWVKGVPAE